MLATAAWAEDPPPTVHGETRPSELVWSLGWRFKMDDMRQPGHLGLSPMIGVRYGRWRTGVVDGDSWHRFGQIKTDNTLTYDWLDSEDWRTSLSASIVNFQRDSTFDAFEPGRKTVRGKATIDYLGWSHWSVGLVMTQDLLGRGVGTALSPGITFRQALSDDSTLLLSQSFTWASAPANATSHRLSPEAAVRQGAGWSSLDSSVTLRQRYTRHISWYGQINRSQVTGALYPTVTPPERSHWNAQIGVIYFGP